MTTATLGSPYFRAFPGIVFRPDGGDAGGPPPAPTEDDLLGREDPTAGAPEASAATPTTDVAGGPVQPVPVDQVQPAPAGDADAERAWNQKMEDQRKRLEAERDTAVARAVAEALRGQPPAQPAAELEQDLAPDPEAYPPGAEGDRAYQADRDAWLISQTEQNVMARLAPQLQRTEATSARLAAIESERAAQARLGEHWDAACSYVNALLREPGPVGDLAREGWDKATDKAGFGEALYRRFASGQAAAVDTKALEQAAYQRGVNEALKLHADRAAQNPHNLAPPSVSGMVVAPVQTHQAIRPGSKEEERLLAQP